MKLKTKNCPVDGEKVDWKYCCRCCDHVSILKPAGLGETWIACGKLNFETIRVIPTPPCAGHDGPAGMCGDCMNPCENSLEY